ncbi:LysM peptidoglycan-binding domain-containing protein [Crocinitomicaceae bacterium]|nr:LysM peptidoglycan-binding domain-containing protein [Crocinitomicaceae bacterium]MDC1186623.1 LysM peptidoglycan-binding domain-containing protein [Crocinitomicaceae bacterium]
MKNIICTLFLLTSLVSFAQPEGAQIEVIEGKRYYIHIVQGGNTLYGIHRLYNIPVEDIIAANPEAKNGLAEGQRILVPIRGMESLPENLVLHKVLSQETLYGIAKKYGTTVERLVELNPGIENGLKVDQEISVPYKLPVGKVGEKPVEQPKVKITFTDSTIKHTVLKGETLYSISKRFMVPTSEIQKLNNMRNDRLRPGDVINIPIKKERIEKVEVREVIPAKSTSKVDDTTKIVPSKKDSIFLFKKKEVYNVAILMPLFLDRGEGSSPAISNLAAEYYMGARFAIDSLQALGLKAKMYIHDSKNDSTTLMELLKKPEFAEMDLIIGPFFASNAEYAAKWAKDHGVRMVCPVATSYEILRNNPFVYEAVTSGVTLNEKLAKYIAATHNNEQIILVTPNSEKDKVLSQSFRNGFNALSENQDSLPKIIETTTEDFATFIKPKTNYHVVYLCSDKTEVGLFLSNLNQTTIANESCGVTVYGTKDWENFSNLTDKHLAKFKVHYATPYDLNYKNDRTKNFDKSYRKSYRTQVSKMALQGYDVTMFYCQSLLMGKTPRKGIMNNFIMEQKGEGNGYENTNCVILKHNGYSFVKLKEMND